MNNRRIDLLKTGYKIKYLIRDAGYSVKDIQEYLGLGCPQCIYRWFNGKILPSVEHLYALSVLLNIHMESLLVVQGCYDAFKYERIDEISRNMRLSKYYQECCA